MRERLAFSTPGEERQPDDARTGIHRCHVGIEQRVQCLRAAHDQPERQTHQDRQAEPDEKGDGADVKMVARLKVTLLEMRDYSEDGLKSAIFGESVDDD